MPSEAPKSVVRRQKLRGGIPRDLYNRLVHEHHTRDDGTSSMPGDEGAGRNDTIVKVKNVTGGDVDRFAILQVDDALITPSLNAGEFQEDVAIKGIAPTTTGKFVIALEPIPSNSIGRALASGVTAVRLRVPAALGDYADAESGVTATLLTASTGTARVLWAESTGTTRWAVVRFPDTSGGSGGAHAILDGSTHSDSVAQGVTAGSLIYGNATPKWDELVIGTAGQVLTVSGGLPAWAAAASSGYSEIQEEGSALTARTKLNFIGAAITAADNAGSTRTDVTLSASPDSASVVGTGRTVSAGAGMSGGGDLSANRTLTWAPDTFVNNVTLWDAANASRTLTAGLSGATDPVITFSDAVVNISTGTLQQGGTAVVLQSRTLTAGAGLTGGGTLAADRTFDVGAGTGITVNANDVALTVPVSAVNGGTAQTSWTAGDLLYASAANTLAKLGIGSTDQTLKVSAGLPVWATPDTVFSGAMVYDSAGASNVGGSIYSIKFDSEVFDTDGYHTTADPGNTKLTVPTTGKYLVGFNINLQDEGSGTDFDGDCHIGLCLNGEDLSAPEGMAQVADWGTTAAGTDHTMSWSRLMDLTAADYLECRLFATNGIGIKAGLEDCQFWIYRVGGAAAAPSAVHNLLDASTHPDTVAQTVTRGSLIYGNSTPKWDELVIGAANRVLASDGTDAAWTALTVSHLPTFALLSSTHSDTLAGTVVLGDLIHGNATPKWARVAGNTSTQKRVLTQTGTGTISAVPEWSTAGVIDTGATLPTSPTPTAGQQFWHTPTGRKYLMQYNGTTWDPIKSSGTTTLYVDTGTGADTQNKGTGTGTDAYNTIQYALDQLPPNVGGNVTINITGETYAESVTIQGKYAIGAYTLTLQGTLNVFATGIDVNTGSVAGSGTTPATVVRTGAWITNQVQHKLIRFQDATSTVALRGDYSLVDSNDNAANSVATCCKQWDAAPDTADTFDVRDWETGATNIDPASGNALTIKNAGMKVVLKDLRITSDGTNHCLYVDDGSVIDLYRVYCNGGMAMYSFCKVDVIDGCLFDIGAGTVTADKVIYLQQNKFNMYHGSKVTVGSNTAYYGIVGEQGAELFIDGGSVIYTASAGGLDAVRLTTKASILSNLLGYQARITATAAGGWANGISAVNGSQGLGTKNSDIVFTNCTANRNATAASFAFLET